MFIKHLCMKTLQLTNTLSLLLVPDNKKVRLVITDNHVEVACRKETPRNLIRFLESDEYSLFKGRLRLYKRDNDIIITLKEQITGYINSGTLKKEIINLT